MTIIDVKKGLLEQMQTIFPKTKYKYYAVGITEGFERPSFFTQLKPTSIETVNFNTRSVTSTLYITFHQEVFDEAVALKVIEQLKDLFCLYVKIGDRAVKVEGFSFEFVGNDDDTAQITVDIQWSEKIEHLNDAPLMQYYDITTEV